MRSNRREKHGERRRENKRESGEGGEGEKRKGGGGGEKNGGREQTAGFWHSGALAPWLQSRRWSAWAASSD